MKTGLFKAGLIAVLLAASPMLMLVGCNNDDGDCKNGHCHAPQAIPAVAPPTPAAPAPTAPIAQDAPAPVAPPVVAAPAGAAVKRAVLVGINLFTNPGAPQLAGCVNDEKNIDAKALQAWGFNQTNIVVITDLQATNANVKAALVAVVAASKPGDTILYWQSSHGATDTDPVTGELMDVLCCSDFDWDPAHEFTSNDFKAIFGAAAKGVNVYAGIDACHSGDLDKNVAHHKYPVKAKSPTVPEHVRIRVAKARTLGKKSRSITDGVLDIGFLSGCKTDQTSADSQDDNGIPCGAFTNQFLKDIDAFANQPLKAAAAQIDQDLAANGYDQTPMASGSLAAKPWMKN